MLSNENKDFKKGIIIEGFDTSGQISDDGRLNQDQELKAENEFYHDPKEISKKDDREENAHNFAVYKAKTSEEKEAKPNLEDLLAEFLKETRHSIPHSKRDIDASLLLDIVTFFAAKGITVHSSDVYRLLSKKVLSDQQESKKPETEDDPDESEDLACTNDSDELMEG